MLSSSKEEEEAKKSRRLFCPLLVDSVEETEEE